MTVPTFGQGTNILYQARLIEDSQTINGYGTNGSKQGGTPAFSANGFDIDVAGGGLPIAVDAFDQPIREQYRDKGTYLFDIDQSWLSDTGALSWSMTRGAGGSPKGNITHESTGALRAQSQWTALTSQPRWNGSTAAGDKPSQASISMEWDLNNIAYTWYNGLIVIAKDITADRGNEETNGPNGANFANVYLGGFQALTATTSDGFRIKESQVMSDISSWNKTEKLMFLGDSFVVNSGVPNWSTQTGSSSVNFPPWASRVDGTSGNGFNSSHVIQNESGTFANESDVPFQLTFYRECYRNNLWFGNRTVSSLRINENCNYAQSGSGVLNDTGGGFTAQTLYDLSVTDGFTPDRIISVYGANDLTNLSTDAAAWLAEYKEVIDKAKADGVKTYVVLVPITPSNDPGLQTGAHETLYDSLRSAALSLENYAGITKVVDGEPVFGTFASPTASLFDTNDLHPNEEGSYELGLLLFSGLLASLSSSPMLITPYPDLSNLVGDVVDQELASNWFNPQGLKFEIFQNPESTENIVGLPGACSIVGELITRRAYSVQVKATDVLSGLSTLSNVFTWSVEQLAVNGMVALNLSSQDGPVIGFVPIMAFDVAVTDLDSGTDLVPRKLYARVTGDVVLIGLDGIQFTHDVVTVGIQNVGFVQINSVGTTGTIDDYDGLL